jgi:hypothetical protein
VLAGRVWVGVRVGVRVRILLLISVVALNVLVC